MTLRKLTLILLSFCCFVFHSPAQSDVENYTLLWKISGNGLKTPSYLFGTMHVRNKKAFEFSDSLLLKLEEVQVFAAEINMDSSVSESFKKAMVQAEDNFFEEDVFSEEELDQLDLNLSEIGFGKKQLKGKKFSEIKEMIDRVEDEKADLMPAYLDLYLYQLSKTLGLETRGLEPLDRTKYLYDTLLIPDRKQELFDDLGNLDKIIESKKQFINVYREGNIDEIQEFYQRFLQVFNPEYFLYKRNRNMVRVFEPIMQEKSMFIAVGCAHLPGEEGIIDLLRKKGYQLEPVKANHRINPDEIGIDITAKQWFRYKNDKDGFSAEFPYPISEYEILGGLFKMKVSVNLLGDHAFIYFSFPANVTQIQNMEDIPQYVNDNFPGRKFNKKDPKLIKINDTDFYEFDFGYRNNSAEKGWFTMKNGFIYAVLYATNQETADTPEADRVINSIQLSIPEKNESIDAWKTHHDEAGAFQIDFPGEFNYVEREVTYPNFEHPTSMQLYMSINQEEGTLAMLRWMDLPPGSYYDDDSTVFQSIFSEIGSFEEPYEFDKNREKDISNPYAIGYELKDSLFLDSFMGKVRLYLRGNRHYLLMLQGNNPDIIKGKNHFFESFKLKAFSPSNATIHEFNGAKVMLPGDPFLSEENDGTYYYDPIPYYLYETKDIGTGISYLMRVLEIPEFYRVANTDSIFSIFIPSNYFYDQVETEVSITQPQVGIFSKSGYLNSAMSTAIVKFKQVLKDNKLVEVYANIHPSDSTNKSVKEVFNSLEIMESDSTFELTSSKTTDILSNLSSTDSIAFVKAKNALNYYTFDSLDISALSLALQKNYQDSSAAYGSTKLSLFESYIEVTEGLDNQEFLLELYESHPDFRIDILDKILDDATNRSIAFQLLKDHPISQDQYYYRFHGIVRKLMDSVRVSESDFQQLINISDKVIPMRQSLISLIAYTRHGILSEDQKRAFINKTSAWYSPKFDSLTIVPDSLQHDTWVLRSCIELFNVLKAKEQQDLVEKAVYSSNQYLVSAALLFQMRNDIKVDKKRLNWVLGETLSGWNLLQTMQEEGLSFNGIDKKLLKNKPLQVMALRSYFEYDEVEIQNIEYHSKGVANRKQYGLFMFSFDYSEERYLAIVQAIDFKEKGLPSAPYVDYHYEAITSKQDEIDFTGILLGDARDNDE